MKLRARGSRNSAAVVAILAIAATLAPVWPAQATASSSTTPVLGGLFGSSVSTASDSEAIEFDTETPFTFVSSNGPGDPHIDTVDGRPPSPQDIAAVEEALDFRIVELPANIAYATSGSNYYWRGGSDDLDVHLRTLSSIPDEAVLVIKSVFEDMQDTIDMGLPDALWHEVDVNWDTSLPDGVLAGASTSWVTVNQEGTNFMIPLALYEILDGSQNTNNAPSMSITINANAVWDMTLQPSNQGINEYYLKTVLLHEVAHGLGFTSGVSELASVNSATSTPWSTRIYGQQNVALSLDDHGSSILQSNNLWLLNVDGTWEKLFDPSPWQSGSSLSHLNESTYPYTPGAPTTAGALMTPYLQRGETSTLDGVVVGVLARLGYTSLMAPLAPTVGVTQDDGNATVSISPVAAGVSNVPAETWTLSITNSSGVVVAQQSVPASERAITVTGLTPGGAYTARVIATTDGNVSQTAVQFTNAGVAPTTDPSTTVVPSGTTTVPDTLDTPVAPQLISTQPSTCLVNGNAQSFGLDAEEKASVYRLYCSYFLRLPDTAGFDYWLQQNSGGTDLRRISDFFADSDEFKIRYGSLSDREYVQLTYINVLERQPDAGGYAYWVSRLENGLSRGDLTLFFSDSPEFRERTHTG